MEATNTDMLFKVISACVSPAMMLSACSMMVLAFLNRQGVLTGRLRELHNQALNFAERAQKENSQYLRERAELAIHQAKEVFVRARTVKWVLVFLFFGMTNMLLTSILLGAGVYFPDTLKAASITFVLGVLSLATSVVFALCAATLSLGTLKTEEIETERMLAKFMPTKE